MNNQVTTDEKDKLTKTFAIVGFIVLIIFGVWLAVKIVSYVPSAFSSLASLADSVYNYDRDENIIVLNENNLYNTSEAFTLSWSPLRRPGTYTFSYACTDGLSVDVRVASDILALACGTPFLIDGATQLELSVESEKNRFTDIPYTITYTKNGESEVTNSVTKNITVVNATIPVVAVVGDLPKPETPVVKPSSPTAKPTYVAQTPTRTITKTVLAAPVSDPKGTIDLKVTFLGSGTLSGSTFTKATKIDNDTHGAIQFEIKNIGTKTAEDWSYVANLPADITYTSGDEKALKPNERAIITLGFDGLTKTGTEKVDVTVTAKSDKNTKNNKATWSVTIID